MKLVEQPRAREPVVSASANGSTYVELKIVLVYYLASSDIQAVDCGCEQRRLLTADSLHPSLHVSSSEYSHQRRI